jgi:hypothetical protein
MTNPVDQIASKALGAAKAGQALFEGLTGVFRKLAQDHGEVSALLLHLNASTSPDTRSTLFPKIRAELLAHEAGELKIVYPAFRAVPELAAIAAKHDLETSELRDILDELSNTPYDSPDWQSKCNVLVDTVKQHVADEEQHFFPEGEKLLKGQTDELKKQFEATKQTALSEVQ